MKMLEYCINEISNDVKYGVDNKFKLDPRHVMFC